MYNVLSKDPEKGYMRWKEEICTFIDEYWDYFRPGKASKGNSCLLFLIANIPTLQYLTAAQEHLHGKILLPAAYPQTTNVFSLGQKSMVSQV